MNRSLILDLAGLANASRPLLVCHKSWMVIHYLWHFRPTCLPYSLFDVWPDAGVLTRNSRDKSRKR